MYSQSARKKALEMLALTGDFEKSARMSGISGRTLRRWAANAAGPQRRTCGAKFEPYGDEVRGKAMEMARKGASCRDVAEALGIGSPDVVRYWLKGGGTKGARVSGRARTPEGASATQSSNAVASASAHITSSLSRLTRAPGSRGAARRRSWSPAVACAPRHCRTRR